MEASSTVLKPEGDDVLVRLILHPREINKSSGVFAAEALLGYTKVNDKVKKSPVVWSVGLRKALKTVQEVHAYGCRTAATSRNERFNNALKKDKDAIKGREPNYLGFYEFVHSKIISISIEETSVVIEQKTEHGEEAHCNVTMSPSEAMTYGDWSDARTRFIAAMAVLLSGPEKHICVEDQDLREELEKVDLPKLPRDASLT